MFKESLSELLAEMVTPGSMILIGLLLMWVPDLVAGQEYPPAPSEITLAWVRTDFEEYRPEYHLRVLGADELEVTTEGGQKYLVRVDSISRTVVISTVFQFRQGVSRDQKRTVVRDLNQLPSKLSYRITSNGALEIVYVRTWDSIWCERLVSWMPGDLRLHAWFDLGSAGLDTLIGPQVKEAPRPSPPASAG